METQRKHRQRGITAGSHTIFLSKITKKKSFILSFSIRLVFVVFLLFFSGACVRRNTPKRPRMLGRKGNNEKGRKQGRGRAAAERNAQPSPASSRDANSLAIFRKFDDFRCRGRVDPSSAKLTESRQASGACKFRRRPLYRCQS